MSQQSVSQSVVVLECACRGYPYGTLPRKPSNRHTDNGWGPVGGGHRLVDGLNGAMAGNGGDSLKP